MGSITRRMDQAGRVTQWADAMSITIPCDTIARLSTLIDRNDDEPIFHTMRLDNGRVITTDRKFLAVEQVAHFTGVHHIALSDALVQQCITETQFNSVLSVTPNSMLKWTSARTSLGYNVTENIGIYPDEPTRFDAWYERVVAPCLAPADTSKGAMVVDLDLLARLVATSPSGSIVYEQHIDISRPTVLRDINSPDWCGFFLPRLNDGIYYAPATVPQWLAREV